MNIYIIGAVAIVALLLVVFIFRALFTLHFRMEKIERLVISNMVKEMSESLKETLQEIKPVAEPTRQIKLNKDGTPRKKYTRRKSKDIKICSCGKQCKGNSGLAIHMSSAHGLKSQKYAGKRKND
jgi:hypothetical protein